MNDKEMKEYENDLGGGAHNSQPYVSIDDEDDGSQDKKITYAVIAIIAVAAIIIALAFLL